VGQAKAVAGPAPGAWLGLASSFEPGWAHHYTQVVEAHPIVLWVTELGCWIFGYLSSLLHNTIKKILTSTQKTCSHSCLAHGLRPGQALAVGTG